MTFEQQVLLTLIDKGLLALLLLAAGFAFKWLLQDKKARDEALHALAPNRTTAYQELWKTLGKVPPSSDQAILPDVRKQLADALSDWYHEKSGALFLSWRTAKRFLIALNLVRDDSAANEAIRDAVSALRTQLKRDCGIYGPFEVAKQLPSPRSRS